MQYRAVHQVLDDGPSDELGLIVASLDGSIHRYGFGELAAASRRVASWLAAHGVERGERVAIVLPQRVESPLLHTACSRLGAIASPLSPMFGVDGLAARLADAEPRLVVTISERVDVLRQALALAQLGGTRVYAVDDQRVGAAWRGAPELSRSEHAGVGAEDPAFLVYTSGTTNKPKGVVLPHRVVDGRLPGFQATHPHLGARDGRAALFYSPADWSWIGGLLDSLFAPWALGCPVLAQERNGSIDLQRALQLWGEHGVTDAFLPPTAIKALSYMGQPPTHRLRALHCAGEPLAAAVSSWAQQNLADSVCNVFGLTEAAFLVGTSAGDGAPAGVLGRPYPTHQVEIRDGELVVRAGSPTLMLGYWNGPAQAPVLPLTDGCFATGDLVKTRLDGFLEYLGRTDDMIKSSGYRLGPAEIEASLLGHPAVAECAVVGIADEALGQAVKAFVRLRQSHEPSPALHVELRRFVRDHLGAHAQPRSVEFVTELPMTITGKIRRQDLRAPGASSQLGTGPDGPRS